MNAPPSTVAPNIARSRQAWTAAAWLALALAIACVLVELAAGPGYRLGWWGLGAGLQAMRWAATVAAAGVVLAFVATALAHRARMRRPRAIFLLATALGLAAVAPPATLWLRLQRLPRIHDISTDTENPPRYVALVPLRQGARNPVDYDPAVATLQRRGYPDIAPATSSVPAPRAFQRAERVARSMGWEVVAVAPAEGRIEATATSLLFGFKDDIVIRVEPNGAGSRLDLRSLSRVGGSDFGANASRVREFIEKFQSGGEV